MAQCEQERTCLCLDELDSYVKIHLQDGPMRFPVIRNLRSVEAACKGRFICIFAGFKSLFYAWRFPVPGDSSYPWRNWLTETGALPRLSADQTRELVEEGFRRILGLDYEPSVPIRIHEFTAGHPAFIQALCSSILARLDRMGRATAPRITENEVR